MVTLAYRQRDLFICPQRFDIIYTQNHANESTVLMCNITKPRSIMVMEDDASMQFTAADRWAKILTVHNV